MTDRPTIRSGLQRRALRLEYATIVWNIGEAVLTISLGAVAASLALIGFGTVSIVEVFASGVVVWHLLPGHEVDSPSRTRLALRLTAAAFLILGIALAVGAIHDLTSGRRAGESPWGIAYLAVTALVMFGLAYVKRRTAEGLGSAPLRSEATMTFPSRSFRSYSARPTKSAGLKRTMKRLSRTWISLAPAARIILMILREVVPRTIESSMTTTRLPLRTLRIALSLILTPKWRIDWLGSMKVRPT